MTSRWFPAIGAALLLAGVAAAADDGKNPARGSSFGSLKADSAEVQKKAEAWLKARKADAATLAKFQALWKADIPLLDKATQTLVLGDPALGKLLAQAKDADAAAPMELPKVLSDKKAPAFLRNTLALAYGKALVGRKVYEEGLEALLLVKADESVDPAALYFHKAVCEHALMMKDKADVSIDKLLVDVSDSPERYRMVAALMHFDMLTWQEKDLGWIARKMGNIQRRLDLKRGGKQTQKMQKEVLVRLDEMIKELENKQNQPSGGSWPNGGGWPNGGSNPGSSPGTDTSTSPMQDTMGGTANGTGQVDTKRVKEVAEMWGKLPEKDRAEALRGLTRGLPAKDRAVIERYFQELQKGK